MLAALLLSVVVQAAEPKVILFGGVGSTTSMMNACSDQNFWNIGYNLAPGQVDRVVAEIDANPHQPYIIAGHSSGAEYSNEVGRKVKNPRQVSIISLDGFAPRDLQRRMQTACWYASNGKGLRSRNAESMTEENCGTVKYFVAPHCKTAWCLHFALVNRAAPADLSGSTFRSEGYRDCEANTGWLGTWDAGK
jgi:hypothetical protein